MGRVYDFHYAASSPVISTHVPSNLLPPGVVARSGWILRERSISSTNPAAGQLSARCLCTESRWRGHPSGRVARGWMASYSHFSHTDGLLPTAAPAGNKRSCDAFLQMQASLRRPCPPARRAMVIRSFSALACKCRNWGLLQCWAAVHCFLLLLGYHIYMSAMSKQAQLLITELAAVDGEVPDQPINSLPLDSTWCKPMSSMQSLSHWGMQHCCMGGGRGTRGTGWQHGLARCHFTNSDTHGFSSPVNHCLNASEAYQSIQQ